MADFPAIPPLPHYKWMDSLDGYPEHQASEIDEEVQELLKFFDIFPGLEDLGTEERERLALHLASLNQRSFEEGFERGMKHRKELTRVRDEELRRFAHNAKTAMA